MVGFPNKPMGFPTKHDHFGVWNGVPPFQETPIYNRINGLMPGHLWRWKIYNDILDDPAAVVLPRHVLGLGSELSHEKTLVCWVI